MARHDDEEDINYSWMQRSSATLNFCNYNYQLNSGYFALRFFTDETLVRRESYPILLQE